MINFMIMMTVLLVLIIEIWVMKEFLIELIEATLKTDHKEILSKNAPTIELYKNMDIAIHIKHPPIIIKGTLTAL